MSIFIRLTATKVSAIKFWCSREFILMGGGGLAQWSWKLLALTFLQQSRERWQQSHRPPVHRCSCSTLHFLQAVTTGFPEGSLGPRLLRVTLLVGRQRKQSQQLYNVYSPNTIGSTQNYCTTILYCTTVQYYTTVDCSCFWTCVYGLFLPGTHQP